MKRLELLMLLCLLATPSWGQSAKPAPAIMPAVPAVEVPRELTLEKAEAIILQNNLAITAARYGVDAARAQRLAVSLHPNPTVTLGAEQFNFFTHPFDLLSTNPNTAANRLYTVHIDQLVERGNKRRLRTEAADFQLQAADAQVLDAVRQQLFQLRQAFYAVVLARENLRVADENLATINDTERLIKLQVEAGATAEGDLIRFQANKGQFQRDLLSARLAYDQSARDVLNRLGAQPANVGQTVSGPEPRLLRDAPIYVTGDLHAEPVTVSLVELEQAAMSNRADVIAAERNVAAAERALDLAKALRHRDIDIAGEYQRNGAENTVGVLVSFPWFVFNNFQGQIQQAQAQLRQAITQLTQARLQALTDVDKAYQAHQSSQQATQIYTTEALAKAEQSFRIAGVAYREGATSLLELLDAQRTLNQTRIASNQAHFDYRMSIYQLELASGKRLVRP